MKKHPRIPNADQLIPTISEFRKGFTLFQRKEPRDSIYTIATFLLQEFWGNPKMMADSLGVLLLIWNQAFYRYDSFDFNKLEKCIEDNLDTINSFRKRDILDLVSEDYAHIKKFFNNFLKALSIDSKGSMNKRKSSVATAKALHLLAPRFLPLWDESISKAYGCYPNGSRNAAEKYLCFCKILKEIAEQVKNYPKVPENKTLLKLIDEYNFSKYTRGWI